MRYNLERHMSNNRWYSVGSKTFFQDKNVVKCRRVVIGPIHRHKHLTTKMPAARREKVKKQENAKAQGAEQAKEEPNDTEIRMNDDEMGQEHPQVPVQDRFTPVSIRSSQVSPPSH